jgi:hypothetical protein
LTIVSTHDGLQQKRRSLEEKARALEEGVRLEKLAIDKKFLVEILDEENRIHNDAVKELEEKITSLEQQMKTPPSAESAPDEKSSKPEEEAPEDIHEDVSVDILPPPEQSDVVQEGSRRKKRNLF